METLLACYLHDTRAREHIVEPHFQHRLSLSAAWQIQPGWRILDVGCGQGESSLVLALAAGPQGRIVGIDTAPPSYGGPYTVGQSQKYIQASALGDRIQFRRDDTASLLRDEYYTGLRFDAAILCHSLWYFPNKAAVGELFQHLAAAKVRYICLAEYGSRASRRGQVPHLLAAQAQATFHTLRKSAATGVREPNVRSALTPAEIIALARESGWRETRSGYVQPGLKMRDGHWEAQFVSSPLFRQWIQEEGLEEAGPLKDAIRAVEESKEGLRGAQTVQWETMDVFWAVLELQ